MKKFFYFYSLLLTAFLWLGSGTMWGATLTVADGSTTNEYLPIYGYYADTGFKNQFIYSSSDLSTMNGGEITSMAFYSATSTLTYGTTAKIVVRLAEISSATFASAAYLTPTMTEVYNGNFNTVTTSGSDKLLVLDFSSAYVYNGGNLLVEVQLSPKGSSCPASSFYGISSTNNGLNGYGGTYANKYLRNFLPKVTFTYTAPEPPACDKPTGLSYDNVTASSVDLSWTAGADEVAWNVAYKADGDADWTLVENVATNPYTLMGLEALTDYQVKVQAVCKSGSGVSPFSNTVSFPTPCADLVAPFEAITFAGLSNNTNVECWDNTASTCFSNPAGTTQKYYVWGVFKYSGNEMLRMNNFNTRAGSALINTPNIIIPNDGKEYELVFDYIHSSSQGDPFYVKVSENGGASFSDLKSFAKNSSTNYDAAVGFTEGSVSLAGYNNKTIILQFYATADYGNGAIFLDNVRIKASSSCVKPTALSYTNLTASSVDLSWTAGASETAWNVRYMADGDADWTVIPADDNDGFTVSGLSDNTHYTMQVQADCGSEVVSEWNSTAIDFTTKCNAFTMPFEQTFNDLTAGIPDCWDNSEGTTTEADYKWNYFATGYDGKCVRFEALYNANGNDNYLKTPSITISAAARLSFRYKNPKGAALSVYYAIDGGSKTVLQSSFDTKTSWSDKVEIDLPAACEGHAVEIFFKGVSNCSYGDAYIYLDEVSVKAQPTCFAPTGLGYSAVTAEGATLSWTVGKEGDNAWVVEYSKNSDFSSSSSVAATTNPFTLTGLDEQSTYYVRVKTKCGESEFSEVSDAINFTTKCAAIVLNSLNPSWEENFDDETNETVVACWDNSASTCFSNPAGSTPAKYVWGVIRTGSYGDYKYSIYMRNFNVRAGTALINTPSFTLPSDKNYEFTFKYNHLASCDPLVIKISVNGGEFAAIDGASYTNTSGTNSYSDPGTLIEQSIDLSAYKGKTITLQFFTTANYGDGAIWIDDLSIHEKAACEKPATITLTSTTPEGAVITWTAGADEAGYQYCVVASGEDADWSAPATTTALTATINGKAVGTTYDFYVRSDCGGAQSEAVNVSFTPAINDPTVPQAANITSSSAVLSWTAADGISKYEVLCLREGAEVEWTGAAVVENETSVTVDTLAAQTNYVFYVRSYYVSETLPDGARSAAINKPFQTKCAAFVISSSASYEENFESGIPACWDATEVVDSWSQGYRWESNNAGKTGKCLRFNNYYVNHILATEPISLTADANLTFYYKNTQGATFQVMISVEGADRVDLGDALGTATDWTKKEIDLTAYTGSTVQLFFYNEYKTSYSSYLWLDELTIEAWPACRKPASISPASAVTGTTATISWTAGGDATNYQYAVALKDKTPVWDPANVVEALSVELTGLTPITNYDVYVRTYCSASEQSEAQKVSFQTDCGAVNAPVEIEFSNALPGCWTATTATYTWAPYNRGSNNYCVRFDSYMNGNGNTADLTTAQIKVGDNMALTFDCKNKDGGAFTVDMYVAETDETIQIFSDLTGVADWTEKVYNLSSYSGKTVNFIFHGTSNEAEYYSGVDAYLYVDNFRVVKNIILADNVDNTATLTSNRGNTLDVTIGRTIFCDGDYNTICLPFDLPSLEGTPLAGATVKKFKYAVIEPDELQVRVIDSEEGIKAGVPYLIKFAAGDNIVSPLFKNVTISASAAQTIGQGEPVAFVGTFAPVDFTADNENTLFVHTENKLTWAGKDSKLKAFRAYFQRTSSPSAAPLRPGMRARIVEHEEISTGCENINAANGKAIKLLENNQVVIIRNGVKYTIQGQKIQ